MIEPEGNLDEAEERCGPLPPDVVPIAGLQSAWAMGKVPIKDGEASLRAATTSLVVRLSDDGVPCGEALDAEMIGCPRAWAVDVTVRNADVVPGHFALGDYAQGYNLATAHRVHGACERDQQLDAFGAGALEIFTVTDDCVVGRLVDTADDLAGAGTAIEGGFVALRCD